MQREVRGVCRPWRCGAALARAANGALQGALPSELRGAFDFVLIDPPFITREVGWVQNMRMCLMGEDQSDFLFLSSSLDPRWRNTVKFRVESGFVSGFFLEHLSLGLSYYL